MVRRKLQQSTNQVMAGQLTAPDQSVRIVSNILSNLSSIAMSDSTSESSIHAASLLSSQLVPVSEFDLWFLRGDSVEVRLSVVCTFWGRVWCFQLCSQTAMLCIPLSLYGKLGVVPMIDENSGNLNGEYVVARWWDYQLMPHLWVNGLMFPALFSNCYVIWPVVFIRKAYEKVTGVRKYA